MYISAETKSDQIDDKQRLWHPKDDQGKRRET